MDYCSNCDSSQWVISLPTKYIQDGQNIKIKTLCHCNRCNHSWYYVEYYEMIRWDYEKFNKEDKE